MLLASCAALSPPALEGKTRIEYLPYPSMTPEQVEVYIACRIALGGNERRREALGEDRVASALDKCMKEFWRLDDWWPVYVKLWSLYAKQPTPEPTTE